MGTYDVTLPGGKPVVFPNRCVVCEKQNPDGAIKLSFLGIKTGSAVEMAIDSQIFDSFDAKRYGSNTSTKIEGIPACRGCSSGLKWYHRLLKVAYYTAWIPGIIPLVFFHMSTIITVPFLVLCAASPGIFTLIFPPSFGASFWDDKANFEFRSKTAAEEFMALNSDAVLKSEKAKIETPAAAESK